MKNIFKTLWLALAATTFVACNGPEPEPTPPTTAIAFKTLTANGSAGETTTVLTLTFDKVIDGLTAEHIAITAGETGTIKGALTATSGGVYELAVSGIIKSGEITVAVAKANFTITPASKTVNVNYFEAPVVKENSIVFDNGTPLEFKSIVFDDALIANRLFVVASPVAGLTTYNEVMKTNEKGEYINQPLMMFIGHNDMNKTFDVMTEKVAIYGVANNTGIGAEIASFMPGMYPTIKSGSLTTTYNKETGAFSMSFSVVSKSSGKTLSANVSGIYTPTPPPQDNIMTFNEETPLSIRSKYYKVENGGVSIYISPVEVPAADLTKEGHYAKIWVSDANLGEFIEFGAVEEGFEFTYKNVLHYENLIKITPNDLKEAMGFISVMEIAPGEYEIEYEISMGDNTIYSIANGEFVAF